MEARYGAADALPSGDGAVVATNAPTTNGRARVKPNA